MQVFSRMSRVPDPGVHSGFAHSRGLRFRLRVVLQLFRNRRDCVGRGLGRLRRAAVPDVDGFSVGFRSRRESGSPSADTPARRGRLWDGIPSTAGSPSRCGRFRRAKTPDVDDFRVESRPRSAPQSSTPGSPARLNLLWTSSGGIPSTACGRLAFGRQPRPPWTGSGRESVHDGGACHLRLIPLPAVDGFGMMFRLRRVTFGKVAISCKLDSGGIIACGLLSWNSVE